VSRFQAYIAEAFEAIWRNRTRSLLTMLGMIIGTSSIIAVLGTSKAASGGITATLNSLGDPGISINVDPQQDDPSNAQIQYRDVRIIADATGGKLEHIEPNYAKNITLRANGVKYTTFGASASDYLGGSSLTLASGRFINASDMQTGAHVCLTSGPLALRFYPDGPAAAVGQVLRVGSSRCTIVGVYDQIKAGFLTALGGDDFFVMPYPVFHEIYPGPVDGLNLYAAPGVSAGDASDAVTAVLHKLHGERAKYTTQNNAESLKQFNTVLGVVATGLTAIGGVAMLVAGIGIMNIMLVSVTERTREIGLRKSIGASRSDIMLQFLLESILLSLIGGGIGMLLGLAAVLGAYHFIEPLVGPAPIPYLLIMAVAVGFSTFIGTVFGTYPALRASRMDPIAALRS
jgi:putative ABC transport system permease protein